MVGTKWIGRQALIAAALAASTVGVYGAEPAHGLNALLSDLHLTGSGVHEWLDRLGAATGPAHERLLAVNPAGEIVETIDGTATAVTVTDDLEGMLFRDGSGLVLVHNHPSGRSLSLADIRYLGKPGVQAIVAIGHDGSVYAARRGPRMTSSGACAAGGLDAVYWHVFHLLRIEEPSMIPTDTPIETYLPHLTALALARAGCLEYYASMAPERLLGYKGNFCAFTRVAASAAARVVK